MLEWNQHVKPERDRPSSDPHEEAGTWDLENKVSLKEAKKTVNCTCVYPLVYILWYP